jgi:hypothetical protein
VAGVGFEGGVSGFDGGVSGFEGGVSGLERGSGGVAGAGCVAAFRPACV